MDNKKLSILLIAAMILGVANSSYSAGSKYRSTGGPGGGSLPRSDEGSAGSDHGSSEGRDSEDDGSKTYRGHRKAGDEGAALLYILMPVPYAPVGCPLEPQGCRMTVVCF